jgi:sugar fermentation stimulation protein A
MELPKLVHGNLLRRYKRFLADIELDSGELLVAHCPNTGSMDSCWEPGCRAAISHSNNPKRKLAWTLERTDVGHGWIGVNTHRVNAIVGEGLLAGRVPDLTNISQLIAEPRVGFEDHPRDRFDFLAQLADGSSCWVEIKNVTLLKGEQLRFPDARSERAVKHLRLLSRKRQNGDRAILILAINRSEGSYFVPADDIHPEYGEMLREASREGVEIQAFRIDHEETESNLGSSVPVHL